MSSTHYDLLLSNCNRVVLINCEVSQDNISAGFAYFASACPSAIAIAPADAPSIRFPIYIPDDCRNKNQPEARADSDGSPFVLSRIK